MATDELTRDELAKLCDYEPDEQLTEGSLTRIYRSHELLRADRDRLREEREEDAKNLDFVMLKREGAEEIAERLERELAKLREEIAAKDAEIQAHQDANARLSAIVRGEASYHDENKLLRAERDALREELAASKSSWATERELIMSDRRGKLALIRHDLTERERELAEARAEIGRLHEMMLEAGWTKAPR